ncbi:MAG: Yip1 family protein [Ginsengibacter sp.]
MNIIDRVKNILTTPKTEWLVIDTEQATPMTLLTGYVLPLAILASLANVLRSLFFAGGFGTYFIYSAVIGFVSILIGYYVSIYVIDLLAPSFDSEKNLNKSAQLVAYSNTPIWVAAFLSFIPVIGWLLAIAGWVYSIYLFYIGLTTMKKTPEDKKVVYMIIAFIVMFAITFIISSILMASFVGSTMMGTGRFF